MEVDKDVTILALGRPDVRYQALLMGTVQGVIANVDGTGLLEPKGFHSVAQAGKYSKGFAGSISVTQELLDKRPDEVMKYLRAAFKGARAYLALRDEAIKITSQWTKITPAKAAKVHDYLSDWSFGAGRTCSIARPWKRRSTRRAKRAASSAALSPKRFTISA